MFAEIEVGGCADSVKKKRLKPDSSAELHRVTPIGPADFGTALGRFWDDFGTILGKSQGSWAGLSYEVTD